MHLDAVNFTFFLILWRYLPPFSLFFLSLSFFSSKWFNFSLSFFFLSQVDSLTGIRSNVHFLTYLYK